MAAEGARPPATALPSPGARSVPGSGSCVPAGPASASPLSPGRGSWRERGPNLPHHPSSCAEPWGPTPHPSPSKVRASSTSPRRPGQEDTRPPGAVSPFRWRKGRAHSESRTFSSCQPRGPRGLGYVWPSAEWPPSTLSVLSTRALPLPTDREGSPQPPPRPRARWPRDLPLLLHRRLVPSARPNSSPRAECPGPHDPGRALRGDL